METPPSPIKSRGLAKKNRSRRSALKFKEFVWELQDLIDVPREVRHSPNGNRYEYPKKAWEVLDAIVKVMVDALQREERVNIRGFGTFKVIKNPRMHINNAFLGNTKGGKLIGNSPVTQSLPERKLVVFKPSIHLEAMLNSDDPTWEERRAMRTWKKS